MSALSENAGEKRRRTRAWSSEVAAFVLRTPLCVNAIEWMSCVQLTIDGLHQHILGRSILSLSFPVAIDVFPGVTSTVAQARRHKSHHLAVLIVQTMHLQYVFALRVHHPVRGPTNGAYFRPGETGKWMEYQRVDHAGRDGCEEQGHRMAAADDGEMLLRRCSRAIGSTS